MVINGVPHRVTKMITGKRGKGGGFVKATLKNIVSGDKTFEKTFTADEMVEHADLEREKYQYSYSDSNLYVFMNTITFEEVQLPKEEVENGNLLVEGQEVQLCKFGKQVIGVELPMTFDYTVTAVMEAEGGSSGAYHPVLLNSGFKLLVPDHIKENDVIKVGSEIGVVTTQRCK